MKHEEVKQLIREWMDKRGFEPVPQFYWGLDKRGAHPDDVLVRKGRLGGNCPIGPRSAVIMEYKPPYSKLKEVLSGVGQLLYYSTRMGVDNCCLVIYRAHYERLRRALVRVPWIRVLVYSKEGEIEEPMGFGVIKSRARFEVKELPLDLEEMSKESLGLIIGKLGTN